MIRLGGNSRVLYRVAYIIVAKQVCVRTCKVDRWVGFALVQHCRCFAWVHGEVAAVPRTMEPIKHPDQAPFPLLREGLTKISDNLGLLKISYHEKICFLKTKTERERSNFEIYRRGREGPMILNGVHNFNEFFKAKMSVFVLITMHCCCVLRDFGHVCYFCGCSVSFHFLKKRDNYILCFCGTQERGQKHCHNIQAIY